MVNILNRLTYFYLSIHIFSYSQWLTFGRMAQKIIDVLIMNLQVHASFK